MPIITFTYFVKTDPTRHFGKFVSPEDLPHDIGLDATIREHLVRTLNIENKVYDIWGLPYSEDDVDVGIVAYTQDNAWTTYREVNAFDTYIEVCESGKTRRWTKGDRLHKRQRKCSFCKPGGGHWQEITI
jgi:hypothetical protein